MKQLEVSCGSQDSQPVGSRLVAVLGDADARGRMRLQWMMQSLEPEALLFPDTNARVKSKDLILSGNSICRDERVRKSKNYLDCS